MWSEQAKETDVHFRCSVANALLCLGLICLGVVFAYSEAWKVQVS